MSAGDVRLQPPSQYAHWFLPPPQLRPPAVLRQLGRFFAPLAVANVLKDVGQQVVVAALARRSPSEDAALQVAAFGIAWYICKLCQFPYFSVKYASMHFPVHRPRHFRAHLWHALLFALPAVALLAAAGFTPFGGAFLRLFYGVEGRLAAATQRALAMFVLLPAVVSACKFLEGAHTVAKRVPLLTAGRLGATLIAAVGSFALGGDPVTAVIVARYAGFAWQLLLWGGASWRLYRVAAYEQVIDSEAVAAAAAPIAPLGSFVRFVLPLSAVQVFQGFSRPVINAGVALGSAGDAAAQAREVAALVTSFPLAHMFFGFVNEVNNMGVPFHQHLPALRFFAALAAALSALLLALFTALAPLRGAVLTGAIGVSPEIAALCVAPIAAFIPIGLAVAPRAYVHGTVVWERATRTVFWSGPLRLATIAVVALLLPRLGVAPQGALLGSCALVAGFAAEAAACVWAHHRLLRSHSATNAAAAAAAAATAAAGEVAERQELELEELPPDDGDVEMFTIDGHAALSGDE